MSFEAIHYFDLVTGLGVILLQIVSVAVLILLVFGPKENLILDFIKKHFLWIGFLISLSAVLTSTVYSEIIGWVPCVHCWWDRVLIFPQAVIFLVALCKKPARTTDAVQSGGDKNVFWYSLVLTLFGLVNSLYHIYLYYFSEGTAPCDASGVSCVQRLVSEFGGYISIPMNAFTGFASLLVLLLVVKYYKSNE